MRRSCGAGGRCCQRVVRVQVGNGEQGAGADVVEQAGLVGLEVDEEGEDARQVDQVGGVFGGPVVGLDFAQFRRRAAVAHDGGGNGLSAGS